MKNKYLLQKSSTTPNGWVLTDTDNEIVCLFTEGYFNSTAHCTVLEDEPIMADTTSKMARITTEMTDWLVANHADKLLVRGVIGSRLEELRQLRQLRQEDLASLTGYKRQNIGRIERAEYSTGIDIIGRLCDALSCTILIIPNEEVEKIK